MAASLNENPIAVQCGLDWICTLNHGNEAAFPRRRTAGKTISRFIDSGTGAKEFLIFQARMLHLFHCGFPPARCQVPSSVSSLPMNIVSRLTMVLIFQSSVSWLQRFKGCNAAAYNFAGVFGARQHGYAESDKWSIDFGGTAAFQGSFFWRPVRVLQPAAEYNQNPLLE